MTFQIFDVHWQFSLQPLVFVIHTFLSAKVSSLLLLFLSNFVFEHLFFLDPTVDLFSLFFRSNSWSFLSFFRSNSWYFFLFRSNSWRTTVADSWEKRGEEPSWFELGPISCKLFRVFSNISKFCTFLQSVALFGAMFEIACPPSSSFSSDA